MVVRDIKIKTTLLIFLVEFVLPLQFSRVDYAVVPYYFGADYFFVNKIGQILDEVDEIVNLFRLNTIFNVEQPTVEFIKFRYSNERIGKTLYAFFGLQNQVPNSSAACVLGDHGTQHFYSVAVSGVDPSVRWNGHEIVAEVNERIYDAPVIKEILLVEIGTVYESGEI